MFRKVLVTIIALKINLSKILFNKALPSYFLNLIKKKQKKNIYITKKDIDTKLLLIKKQKQTKIKPNYAFIFIIIFNRNFRFRVK